MDDDEVDEAFAEDAANISNALRTATSLADTLPPLRIDNAEKPFDCSDPANIDLSALVQLRYNHQTKQAANGVRSTSYVNCGAQRRDIRKIEKSFREAADSTRV